MNDDRLYTQWIGQRRKTAVPEGFAQRITGLIAQQEPAPGFIPDLYRVAAHRLMKWAAGIAMALLGIFRLLYVTGNLLMGSVL